MFPIRPAPRQRTCTYAWLPPGDGGFTPEECERIIAMGATGLETSTIYGDKVDLSVRSSQVKPLALDPGTGWIFERVRAAAVGVNARWWDFELSGIYPWLQLLRYDKTQHQVWHRDGVVGTFSNRKLSVSVQLSDPRAYKGGELQFFPENGGVTPPRDQMTQGTIVFFPAWLVHQVTPVTKGTRWSLVTFVEGPPFR